MPAYVIVQIEVTDPARYEEYKRLAAPTLAPFGAKYLVRGGKVEALEGEWSGARLVVLEFPSARDARDWWDSEAYRPAKAIRQSCAGTDMILVEGL